MLLLIQIYAKLNNIFFLIIFNTKKVFYQITIYFFFQFYLAIFQEENVPQNV
jgi:hypothetical protein